MRISARNSLKCTVKEVDEGAVNAEVVLQLPDGQEITSIITLDSLKALGIEPGKQVFAVVKASSVMIGVDD